jgi:hypothetical protein
MRLGLGLGLSHRAGGAPSYSAEAVALFAAMTTQPSDARKALIDARIAALKAGGVWARLDWLTVHGAHDAQAGRINWINPAQVATEVSAPSFTADRGYTGNGSSSYLASGWTSAIAGSKMLLNDSSIFAWSLTDVTSSTQVDVGNARNLINCRSLAVGGPGVRVNDGTTSGIVAANSLGMTLATRNNATDREIYRNGVSLGTNAVATALLATSEIFIGALNNTATPGSSPASYSTRQLAVTGWGGHLTAGQAATLHTEMNTYLAAIGAV